MYNWLKDYQRLEEQISYLEFKLDDTERELKRWVEGDLQNVKLQHDSLGAKVEENIEKIKDQLQEKMDQRQKLVDLVTKFKGLENKILVMKYIEGMKLETIAEELNYSPSHIYKKHTEIIKRIKFAEELHTSQ